MDYRLRHKIKLTNMIKWMNSYATHEISPWTTSYGLYGVVYVGTNGEGHVSLDIRQSLRIMIPKHPAYWKHSQYRCVQSTRVCSRQRNFAHTESTLCTTLLFHSQYFWRQSSKRAMLISVRQTGISELVFRISQLYLPGKGSKRG